MKIIDRPGAGLSPYRLQLQIVWHVVVAGDAPDRELADHSEKMGAASELVELPSDALDFLRQRKAEQIRHGPRVERHNRAGRAFRLRRK